MTRIAIHQPEHLPWLGYLDKARKADEFIFLDTVAFKKNYFENRNRIRTPQGWAWVTAPVLLKGRFGQTFLDVEVNNQVRWAEVYWRTLLQNYSRAPFWKTYGPVLEELLLRPWHKLIDLNLALISLVWREFGIATPTRRASTLGVSGKKSGLLLDICRKTGATVYLSGPSGRDYLEQSLFAAAGIGIEFHEFHHPEYPQRFSPFVPGLASIDLLLNEGPEGIRRLESVPS
ncbi:MAG: WbqC family protein [Anaerolineales bacterium]|nr:WbqC family protein [Anaerolineales bacterium]